MKKSPNCGIWANCSIPHSEIDRAALIIKSKLLERLENKQFDYTVCFMNDADMLFMETALKLKKDYPDLSISVLLPYCTWLDSLSTEEREKRKSYMAQLECKYYYCAQESYSDLMFICSSQLLDFCDNLLVIQTEQPDRSTNDMVILAKILNCNVDFISL
ncbi:MULTISPECIES: hypothetical protein [Christensenella]|uniref:hypothetical protein n=1 Tax=Christensenella TaxID=990721 RepID=UPI000831A9E6|nr:MULTISPECIES: hypothetical protein [Christensenella]